MSCATTELLRRLKDAIEQLHADVMAMGVVHDKTLRWKGKGWRGPSVSLETGRYSCTSFSFGFNLTWLPDRVSEIATEHHMRIDQLEYVVRNWNGFRASILKSARKLPQRLPTPCYDKRCEELLGILDEQLQH